MKTGRDFHDMANDDARPCRDHSGGKTGSREGKGRTQLSINEFKQLSRHRECPELETTRARWTVAEGLHAAPTWAFETTEASWSFVEGPGEVHLMVFQGEALIDIAAG